MRTKQATYIALGLISVGLGTAGIVLPLLPTTPFLLLSSWLFAKSSRRWHAWLLNHRRLGPYIHAWRNKSGLTVAQKVRICVSFTIIMGVSVYFSPLTSIRCLLAAIWLFWTVVLLRQKTLRPETAPVRG